MVIESFLHGQVRGNSRYATHKHRYIRLHLLGIYLLNVQNVQMCVYCICVSLRV